MKQSHKTLILWLLIILVFVAFFQLFSTREPIARTTSITAFMADAEAGAFPEIEVRGQVWRGTRKGGEVWQAEGFPLTADVERELREAGAEIIVDRVPETNAWWTTTALNVLPVLLILVLFLFFMRQLQKGGGNKTVDDYKKAPFRRSKPSLTFADLGGLTAAKQDLQPIADYLRRPGNAPPPLGILLAGAPGTGKSALAQALAGEAGCGIVEASGAEFVDLYLGVGVARAKDLVAAAVKAKPCVLIIEDLDAIAPVRGPKGPSGGDERHAALLALCTEIETATANGLVVIGVTSRPDLVDPALTRAGRLGLHVTLPIPDVGARREILTALVKRQGVSSNQDWNAIADQAEGFTPADLTELLRWGSAAGSAYGEALEKMRAQRKAA